jgi:cell wall-associated NlpC family hydrolase
MTDLLRAHGSGRARRTGALVGLLITSVAGTAAAQQREAAVIARPAPSGPSAPSADSIAAASLAALEAFTLRPSPFGAFSASAEAVRDSIVALARAQIGLRYVLGGQSPQRGFDCSGLVKYVMAALSIDLPRTANQQARVGREVPRDTALLRPGDVLTFGRGKRISHVGIYVGNGRMVHASTKARRVIETSLIRPDGPLIKPWRGARSVVGPADSASVADGRLSLAGSANPGASPHAQR